MDRLFQLLQGGIENAQARQDDQQNRPLFGNPYITPKSYLFLSHTIDFLVTYGTKSQIYRVPLVDGAYQSHRRPSALF